MTRGVLRKIVCRKTSGSFKNVYPHFRIFRVIENPNSLRLHRIISAELFKVL